MRFEPIVHGKMEDRTAFLFNLKEISIDLHLFTKGFLSVYIDRDGNDGFFP